jgi:hypothetical protein
MLIADVLHDCKVSGFAEKERLRIEKILKEEPYERCQSCSVSGQNQAVLRNFLHFFDLGLPSGKAKCLALF